MGIKQTGVERLAGHQSKDVSMHLGSEIEEAFMKKGVINKSKCLKLINLNIKLHASAVVSPLFQVMP